jgi:hypothetical protein
MDLTTIRRNKVSYISAFVEGHARGKRKRWFSLYQSLPCNSNPKLLDRVRKTQHPLPERRPMQTPYNCIARSRSALAMTETELRLIAAPAIIGLRSRPKYG